MREVLAPPSGRGAEPTSPFAPNTAQLQSLSNREIATQLFVSENTVKTHCSRAYEKLGAARRTQAVRRGKELGLLP